MSDESALRAAIRLHNLGNRIETCNYRARYRAVRVDNHEQARWSSNFSTAEFAGSGFHRRELFAGTVSINQSFTI